MGTDCKLRLIAFLEPRSIKSTSHSKNLSVIMGGDPSFSTHNTSLIKLAFWHLKNAAKVRDFVSKHGEVWRNVSIPLYPAGLTIAILFSMAFLKNTLDSYTLFKMLLKPWYPIRFRSLRYYSLFISHSIVWALKISRKCWMSSCSDLCQNKVKWHLVIKGPSNGSSFPWRHVAIISYCI